MSERQASRNEILALERSALAAWPALETHMIGGWALRRAGGHTKRSNSANALDPSGSFEKVQREAERLYGEQRLPAVFRITPLAPGGSDAQLEASGYHRFDPSLVMSAGLQSNLCAQAVDIADQPTSEWLTGFAEANAVSEDGRVAHDAIIAAIPFPAAYATLFRGGNPVGFGLAVRDGERIWLFDIVILRAERGNGLGRAIVSALMAWGKSAGAVQACLQVRAENEIALALYRSLGFQETYRYCYRVPQ